MAKPKGPVEIILANLSAARDDFLKALDAIDPALMTAPGLVGDWSARELLGHMAYWTGHAAEAIHRAELDELGTFGTDELPVDERNEVIARVAAESTVRVNRQREEAAFKALIERLQAIDPDWLEERDADGDSLSDILAFDGAEHYREHLLDVRAWFDGQAEPEDEDDA